MLIAWPRIADDLTELECVTVVVDAEPAAMSSVVSYQSLHCRCLAWFHRMWHSNPEDPALILFTSGATSKAKGVLSSQRAVCQALCNIDYIGAIAALTSPVRLLR